MEAHPNAPQMLYQACQMVGNVNVQNLENRYTMYFMEIYSMYIHGIILIGKT